MRRSTHSPLRSRATVPGRWPRTRPCSARRRTAPSMTGWPSKRRRASTSRIGSSAHCTTGCFEGRYRRPMMQLKDKRVIVTGGSRGIGAAVVRAYATAGSKVACLDVDEALGLAVAEASTRAGPGEVRFWSCDVARADAVNATFDAATQWLGGLDVLAHIAGVERSGPAEQVDPAQGNFCSKA